MVSTETGSRLYEQVQDRIATLIHEGAFKPGQRIPSIRRLSGQLGVSVNTVKEAYERLEMRRLIEARPQSGYYVVDPHPQTPRARGYEEADLIPAHISVEELYRRVMHDHDSEDLVTLSIARPNSQLLPAQQLNRLMYQSAQRRPAESVSYLMPPGHRGLREQIAQRTLAAGCSLSPDEIIITAGCVEAVTLSLMLTCRPGDVVAIESPVFFNFLQLLEALELKALEIPMDPAHGMNLDVLEFALDRNQVKACLAITNYSNPLGCRMPDAAKERLVRILEDRDIPLIEDDIYSELSHTDRRPRAAKSYDNSGGVILCSSFSKTLAPGYRVGWVAGGRYAEGLERLKMATGVCAPAPTQIAIGEFLADGSYDRHLRRTRRVYAQNVAGMRQTIGESFPRGTRVSRPDGGFMLWVELPETVDGLELYRRAISGGISIAPGVLFDTSGRFSHHIRLGAAVWDSTVQTAVETIGGLAKDLDR